MQASKHEKIDVIESDLAQINQLLGKSETFRNFLKNQSFGRAEQREVLSALNDNLDTITNNFLG